VARTSMRLEKRCESTNISTVRRPSSASHCSSRSTESRPNSSSAARSSRYVGSTSPATRSSALQPSPHPSCQQPAIETVYTV
jgi:hypothetical protein